MANAKSNKLYVILWHFKEHRDCSVRILRTVPNDIRQAKRIWYHRYDDTCGCDVDDICPFLQRRITSYEERIRRCSNLKWEDRKGRAEVLYHHYFGGKEGWSDFLLREQEVFRNINARLACLYDQWAKYLGERREMGKLKALHELSKLLMETVRRCGIIEDNHGSGLINTPI